MSVSLWRYTEQCEGRPCPGDCDECSFDPDEYTVDEPTVSYGGKNGEDMDVLMDSMGVTNALDSVTWYNGLAETILKWKDIKPKDTIITCLDDYGYGEIEMTTESWKDIGQLQAIWMICVVLFGDYGSSPRYGFIYEKNIKEFHDFIDAITETQRIEYGE